MDDTIFKKKKKKKTLEEDASRRNYEEHKHITHTKSSMGNSSNLSFHSLELWGVPNMLGTVRGFCVTVVETSLSALSLRKAHLKRSMWSLVRSCGALSMEHTLVQASALLRWRPLYRVPSSL